MPKRLQQLIVTFALCLFANVMWRAQAQNSSPAYFGYHSIRTIGLGTLFDVAWRADSHALAVAGGSGIWLLDDHLQDAQQIGEGPVGYVGWHPNGKALAARISHGVTLYDVSAIPARAICTLPDSSSDNAMAWSPDGKLLASSSTKYN